MHKGSSSKVPVAVVDNDKTAGKIKLAAIELPHGQTDQTGLNSTRQLFSAILHSSRLIFPTWHGGWDDIIGVYIVFWFYKCILNIHTLSETCIYIYIYVYFHLFIDAGIHMFGKFPDQKVSKAMTSFPVYYWSQLTQIPNGFLTRPVLKISICFEPCFQIMDCAILPDRRKRREHCQVSCTEALVWYDGLHEVHQWQLEDAGFFTARQQLVVNASTAISLVKATWLALHGHPMESSHLRLYTGYRIQTSTYCFILTAEKRWKTFQPVSPLVTLHCTDISKFIGLQSAFHCFVLRFPLCLGFGLCFRRFACFCSDTWVKSLHWDTI